MKRSSFLISCLCLTILVAATAMPNWPRFRGPNASGEARDILLPKSWDADGARWSHELAGEGDSSPVIWDGVVFVTSAVERGAKRMLQAFDLDTGKPLWKREFESAPHKRHKNNSFATSTPAVDARRVCVLWGQPKSIMAMAYDHKGNELWRRELGAFKSGHGYGVSPILADGKLVVADDQPAGNAIVALDANTGKPLWRAERKTDRASYSTPCVYPHDSGVAGGGIDLVVTDWKQGVTALDLSTGKERWSEVVFDITDKQRAIGSPILWDDMVIATCGFVTGKKRLVALRPPVGGKGKPELVFQLDKGVPHVPTPLAHGGRLYLWGDSGMITCVQLPSGKVLYDRERVSAKGKFFSSPIAVGEHVVNFSTIGEVVVLKTGNKFEIVSIGKLPEGTSASPAAAGGRLVLRTKKRLMCW